MIDASLKSKGDKVISTFESIENKFPSDIKQSSNIIATSSAMGYFAGRVIMRIAFLLFYIFRLQWRILTSSVDMDKQLMPVTGSQYALQSEIA